MMLIATYSYTGISPNESAHAGGIYRGYLRRETFRGTMLPPFSSGFNALDAVLRFAMYLFLESIIVRLTIEPLWSIE